MRRRGSGRLEFAGRHEVIDEQASARVFPPTRKVGVPVAWTRRSICR